MKKSSEKTATESAAPEAEANIEVTLNGLLDEALGQLKPWQKWAVERNFKRQPANRRQVLHAVEMHLAKTSPTLMTVMDAESFTADTPFTTTPAGKGELLQVILDNLPAILDAIIKLIGLFGAFLFACTLLANSANAAGPNCANGGVCSLGACSAVRVQSTSPRFVASPISPRIAAVAPVVSTVVNQARPVAIITNTRQRFEYKPVRAFLGGLRPVKRVASAFRR